MKICTQTEALTKQFTEEQALLMLREAGFDAADLSHFNMMSNPRWAPGCYKEEAKRLRDFALEHQIPILQAHAPFRFNWSGQDFEREIFPAIYRAVEIAAICGARQIVVHPLHHNAYWGHEEEAYQANMAYYPRFLPICAEYGVKVCTENMWKKNNQRNCIDHDVCSRPDEFCRYVDGLNQNGDYFSACLDLGHVALVGENLPQMIRALGSRIGALHIHDNNIHDDTHTLPGVASIDLIPAFEALREIGYHGLFTLEADGFIKHQAQALLPLSLKYMADVSRYYSGIIEK